jgi:hypothetical protein
VDRSQADYLPILLGLWWRNLHFLESLVPSELGRDLSSYLFGLRLRASYPWYSGWVPDWSG